MRRRFVTSPVEIDLRIGSHVSRLALQLLVGKIFTLESCRGSLPIHSQERSGHWYHRLAGQGRTKRVENPGVDRNCVSNSGQWGHRFRRSPAVVSYQDFRGVGVWPNDRDGLDVLLQWQRVGFILEEYDGFLRRFARQLTVRG